MFRQLDQRHSQRATVTLEWDPATGNVQVRWEDHGSPGESFSYLVDPEDARLAFLHPFILRPPSQDEDRLASRPDEAQIAPSQLRRRGVPRTNRD